jgi:hypothetical protein
MVVAQQRMYIYLQTNYDVSHKFKYPVLRRNIE